MRTYKHKQMLTRRILSGKLFCFIDGEMIEFIDPSMEVMYKSDVYYEMSFDNLKETYKTADDILSYTTEMGLWTIEQNNDLEELKKEKINQDRLLARSNSEYEKIKVNSKLKEINAGIARLNKHKYQLISISAEFMAERQRKHFLINYICPDSDLNKSVLIHHYFDDSKNQIDETDIRQIARSEPYRTYWVCAKKAGTPLVSGDGLTELQKSLFYWSSMYDYIFESPDTPDNLNIDNDLAVNDFLRSDTKKSTKGSSNNTGDINTQETFTFAKNETEAEDIYESSGDESRQIVSKTINSVKEHGELRDEELPHIKKEIKKVLFAKQGQQK